MPSVASQAAGGRTAPASVRAASCACPWPTLISRPGWRRSGRVFLASSYLIEKIFAIDGMGLLTFKAIGTRDYGIIMGFLVIGIFIRLFGNLISDLCYALIDPRIRFK